MCISISPIFVEKHKFICTVQIQILTLQFWHILYTPAIFVCTSTEVDLCTSKLFKARAFKYKVFLPHFITYHIYSPPIRTRPILWMDWFEQLLDMSILDSIWNGQCCHVKCFNFCFHFYIYSSRIAFTVLIWWAISSYFHSISICLTSWSLQ